MQRNNDLLSIKRTKNGLGYFAVRDIEKNEQVLCGYGKIIDHQTNHISIQIAPNMHYLPEKWSGRYLNHSCNPNTFVKTGKDGFPRWYALQKIKKGEEITYAYWMTEFKWSSTAAERNLVCNCHSKKCKGRIYAYSELNDAKKARLKNLVSKYLNQC